MSDSDNSFAATFLAQKEVLESTNYGLYKEENVEESVIEGVRVGAWWRNLIHGYINGEIGICAHFHTWNESLKHESRDFAFTFQNCRTEDLEGLKDSPIRNTQFRICVRRPPSEKVELPVPILSCPLVEDSQIAIEACDQLGRLQSFRSIARLYRLNPVLTPLRQWSDTSSGVIAIPPLLGITDGECKVIFIGGRVLSSFKDGCLIDASIKGGAELVDHFAKLERELGGQSGELWPDKNAPCPIVLHAHDNGVVLILDERVPSFGEGVSVSLCPFDSLPATLEWSHTRLSLSKQLRDIKG